MKFVAFPRAAIVNGERKAGDNFVLKTRGVNQKKIWTEGYKIHFQKFWLDPPTHSRHFFLQPKTGLRPTPILRHFFLSYKNWSQTHTQFYDIFFFHTNLVFDPPLTRDIIFPSDT